MIPFGGFRFYIGWVLLFLFQPFMLVAQKQNNQWRFGYRGGINFNQTPPVEAPGSVLETQEGSASVAHPITGALLFYTDGSTVWNANNQPMLNGTGLLGGGTFSSTSAAVIVPKPASSNLYYLVTIDEQGSNFGVRYSVVDMLLDSGRGGIVAGQKNIPLISTNSEKLHVVPTADKCGYWLITHLNIGNTFYAFRITSQGINTTPVVSTLGDTHGNGAGYMKINKQFNRLAMSNFSTGNIELFSFNNNTGVFSDFVAVRSRLQGQVYGLEFSPDGTKLYASNLTNDVAQFDISNLDPVAIDSSFFRVSVGLFPYTPAALQLGPDNRIYVASGGIDAIDFPNNSGAACGFRPRAIVLQEGNSAYGLPQFIHSLVNQVDFTATDSCLANPIPFVLSDSTGIGSISWNFGDPQSGSSNVSDRFNPRHVFSRAGSFTITAIVVYPCFADTIKKTITIADCNPVQPAAQIVVLGDTCQVNVDFSLISSVAIGSATYTWNFGDPNSGSANVVVFQGEHNNPTHRFSQPGSYNVCVRFQRPGFAETTVCRRVRILNCDTVNEPEPCTASIALADSCLETGVNFALNSTYTESQVTWNFGDPDSGNDNFSGLINPFHAFTRPGTYQVTAFYTLACGAGSVSKTVNITSCGTSCDVQAPNVVTPNGDGKNDGFQLLFSCPAEGLDLEIFDRWGKKVFSSNSTGAIWMPTSTVTGTFYYQAQVTFRSGASQRNTGWIQVLAN